MSSSDLYTNTMPHSAAWLFFAIDFALDFALDLDLDFAIDFAIDLAFFRYRFIPIGPLWATHIYVDTATHAQTSLRTHTYIVLTHTVTEGHAFVHVFKTGASFFVSRYSCANGAQIKQRKANLHGRILNANFYPPITLWLMCKTK